MFKVSAFNTSIVSPTDHKTQEADMVYIRKFVEFCISNIKGIGPSTAESRISIIMFNRITQEMVDFTHCCVGGLPYLQELIFSKLKLKGPLLKGLNGELQQAYLNPDVIDVENAFASARCQ